MPVLESLGSQQLTPTDWRTNENSATSGCSRTSVSAVDLRQAGGGCGRLGVFVRQRLQELDEVINLSIGQMAGLAMAVAGVIDEHFLQRGGLAVMKIRCRAIDTEQRRRVVFGAELLPRIIVAACPRRA